MDIANYFHESQHPFHRQYEAMRAFYLENKSAQQVAEHFGYTINAVYSLARDFKLLVVNGKADEHFFAKPTLGRKQKPNTEDLHEQIIALRKLYLSVEDIKEKLDAQGKSVSESYIYHTIKQSGFGRLPRRTITTKREIQSKIDIKAPRASQLIDKST
jgi:transposase